MFFKKIFFLIAGAIVCFGAVASPRPYIADFGIVADDGPEELKSQVATLGDVVSHGVIYLTMGDYEGGAEMYREVQRYLDYDYGHPLRFTVVLKFSTDLRSVRDGKTDARLVDFISAAARGGQSFDLRPLHEANLAKKPPDAYREGNDVKDFIPAWRHIVDTIRTTLVAHDVGEDFLRIELNLNRTSASDWSTNDFALFYPGEEYFDIALFSSFGRCGLDRYHMEYKSFSEGFDAAYEKWSGLSPSRPIGVAEFSVTSLCGGDAAQTMKAQWFKDAFVDLVEKYPRVQKVSAFLGQTTVDGTSVNWGVETPVQQQMIVGGVQAWKRARGQDISLNARTGFFQKPAVAEILDGATYPWAVRGVVRRYFSEPDNDALNSVTGDEFGQTQWLGILDLRQGVLFSAEDHGKYGANIQVGARYSPNENQPWNRYTYIRLSPVWCMKKPEFADWGASCLALSAEHRSYTTDVSARLKDDNRLSLDYITNFGGTWE